MLERLARYWWLFLLRGLLAILFGVLAFLWPAITLAALVLLFAAFVFADGVLAIVQAIRSRTEKDRWWLYLLEGIAGIAFGVLTFLWPGITAVVLLAFIAAWAIVTGIFEVAQAIRLRKEIEGEWALVLSGILSVLFGVVLLVRPGIGALAVVWIIAFYAVLFGAFLTVLSLRLRGLARELFPASASGRA